MYKVMIVDDMEIVRIELKRLKLWGESSGFQITDEAKNGHEAFIKLQAAPVDLVITDIRMPIVDGMELLEKITASKLATCVVLLSDYREYEYVRKGFILGAFDYLAKPVNEADLSVLLLRTRQFILKKEMEENPHLYDSAFEMEELFQLIENGTYVEDEASAIFDKVIQLENNFDKANMLIKRAIAQASEIIKSNMAWLEQFIDLKAMEDSLFSNSVSVEDLRLSFTQYVSNISKMVKLIYFNNSYSGLINQISIFILENIDSEINLLEVSKRVVMNKNYLSEVFRNKTGISFLTYLTSVKMERAKKLLIDGDLKGYEIAEKLGYKDTEYFSKLFKKHEGVSPSEYKSSYYNK